MLKTMKTIWIVLVALLLISTEAMAGGVAGVCGLGNDKSYSSPPTNPSYLCTQGIASSTSLSSGRWTWTCAGSDGSAPVSCSADNCGPAPVDGVCNNSTRNACSAGTANDGAVADTASEYRWRCDGQNYGNNSGICSVAKPPPSVAGVCDNSARNACSAGNPNDGAIADTSSEYRWRCDGENGGANSGTCSFAKPPTPVNGVCNNSTRNACSAGSPNDGAIADTSTEYRWRCDGQNGGNDSGTCSLAKPPSPVNGVCNNSTRNACSAGASNDGAIADTSTEYRWRCDGQNGGNNSGTCSLAKPVTGTCGPAQHWTTADSGTLTNVGLCDAGAASAISSPNSSTWAWTCGTRSCTAGRCSNGSPGPYGAETRLIDWDGWVGDGCYQEMRMSDQMKNMNGGTYPPQCGTSAANSTSNRVCITQRLGKANCNDAAFIGFDGRMRSTVGGNCPPPPADGRCGIASSGSYTDTAPSNNLRSIGGASSVTFNSGASPNGVWQWSCSGQPGAADASCGRPRTPPGMCTYNGTQYLNGATWNNTIPCPPGSYGSRTYQYRCNNGSVVNDGQVGGMCEAGGPAGPN